ncbi:MAG: BatD family protein [Muribaculaceae bacterium]|nr:BatD family protein [Muribaculaceae bacterium]MDE7350471.1 BatD family protein [Muribaculaceae bacterium]
MTHYRLYILTLLLALFTSAASAAGKFQISVATQTGGDDIEVGEQFYVYMKLDNIDGDPSKPDVPGAVVKYFTLSSQSTSVTTINGKMTRSSSRTYVATCSASKEGSFSIGPLTVDGVRSNQASYTIVKSGSGTLSRHQQRQQQQAAAQQQAAQSQRPDDDGNTGPKFIGKGNEKLFLKASVSKTTAYEQEALVYTVKLYSSYAPIKFIGATEAPKFDGFVVEESDETSKSLHYETYNGHEYATAIIARYIIFPQMTGKLTVKGNTYTVSTDEQEYYDDPYFRMLTVRRPIQLNVTPNDLVVDVKPLPTPQPADFSGGVGQFSISSSLPSASLKTNQAASIIYEVKGSGNIKYVKLPDLNALYPKQLEVFSPTTQVDAVSKGSSVSGSVKFDYSFTPLEMGTYQIPEVSLVYFDPSTGKYERSVAKGYTVEVDKGALSEKSQTKNRLKFSDELMPVGKLSKTHVPMVYGFGYWLWYIIPAIALACVVIVYRRHLKSAADIVGTRMRKAGKVAARRLKKAAACMKSGDRERFYDEMLVALWGYVGAKLNIPTSELNRQNVAQRLLDAGAPQASVDGLVSVLDDCEFAKYAPGTGEDELKAVYKKGADVINALEDAKLNGNQNQ